jgi:hypothetical protein
MTQRLDKARFLREGDEFARQHDTPCRIVPSNQCLHASDPAVAHGHDRLVDDPKFVKVERAAHARIKCQFFSCGNLHLRPIEGVATTAREFSLKERAIRIVDEPLAVVGSFRKKANANTGADMYLVPLAKMERLIDHRDDPLRQSGRRSSVCTVDDHHELIAADSSNDIRLTEKGFQPGGDLLQKLVAKC